MSEAHRNSLARPFIEPVVTLLLPRGSQLRRQVSLMRGVSPESGVVRAVPRDIANGVVAVRNHDWGSMAGAARWLEPAHDHEPGPARSPVTAAVPSRST